MSKDIGVEKAIFELVHMSFVMGSWEIPTSI